MCIRDRFITAWKEHAVEAFELEAFDYILKPYQESRITGMLQKLEAAWQQQQTSSTPAAKVTRENDTINLVKDERIIVTPINDIYYAEAHEKMTFVYTRRESLSLIHICTSRIAYKPCSEIRSAAAAVFWVC